MKNLTLLFALFLLVSSCTSIEKLVDQGDYNGAVLLAIKRLQSQKKKSTKNVRGLEEAFAKINERDLTTAKRLLDQNRASNWEKIYHIYADVQDRQDAIQPLLPLVSKDGYRANFKFVAIDGLLNSAAESAAKYDYDQGVKFLAKAKKGDKDAARQADGFFRSTARYIPNFKNANELSNEALYYGKTRVLVDVVNKAPVVIPKQFEQEVLSIHVKDLNTKWTEYYVSNAGNNPIDVHAVLEITGIDISPEREIVNHYTDSKEIKDGFTYVLDKKGNVMKDTSGNDIKVDKFRTIFAEVVEIKRTKSARVIGNVYYYDMNTGEKFRTQPLNVEAVFDDIACQFKGDKRALQDSRLKWMKAYPAPFPTNYELTMNAAVNLKEALKKQISRSIT